MEGHAYAFKCDPAAREQQYDEGAAVTYCRYCKHGPTTSMDMMADALAGEKQLTQLQGRRRGLNGQSFAYLPFT